MVLCKLRPPRPGVPLTFRYFQKSNLSLGHLYPNSSLIVQVVLHIYPPSFFSLFIPLSAYYLLSPDHPSRTWSHTQSRVRRSPSPFPPFGRTHWVVIPVPDQPSVRPTTQVWIHRSSFRPPADRSRPPDLVGPTTR